MILHSHSGCSIVRSHLFLAFLSLTHSLSGDKASDKDGYMGNGFPLGVTPHPDTSKANGFSGHKYMIMGCLNLRARKFRLEFLEDNLLDELCRKFVDRASNHLEEDL
jgi:hypothetical protein